MRNKFENVRKETEKDGMQASDIEKFIACAVALVCAIILAIGVLL